MGLPQIDVPKYTLNLPSNDVEVEFRPFLVKEEKILLMAMEAEDSKEIFGAIKQIVENCTFGKLNTDEMAIIDIEYVFLELRKRSKGEISKISFRCRNEIGEGEEKHHCNHLNSYEIDLDTVEVINKDFDTVIKFTESAGVEMKVPSMGIVSQLSEMTEGADVNDALLLMGRAIDTVYNGEDVHATKDFSDEEVLEWMESLTDTNYKKLEEYFKTLPKLQKKLHFKCESCGYEEDITLEGLRSFFA